MTSSSKKNIATNIKEKHGPLKTKSKLRNDIQQKMLNNNSH